MLTWSLGWIGFSACEAVAADQLDGPVGDHLVGVHVARGARAGLKDVDRKLIVELAVGDFAAGGQQRLDLLGRRAGSCPCRSACPDRDWRRRRRTSPGPGRGSAPAAAASRRSESSRRRAASARRNRPWRGRAPRPSNLVRCETRSSCVPKMSRRCQHSWLPAVGSGRRVNLTIRGGDSRQQGTPRPSPAKPLMIAVRRSFSQRPTAAGLKAFCRSLHRFLARRPGTRRVAWRCRARPPNLDCPGLLAVLKLTRSCTPHSAAGLPVRRRRAMHPALFVSLCPNSKAIPSSTSCSPGSRDVDLVHLMLELAADAYPDLDPRRLSAGNRSAGRGLRRPARLLEAQSARASAWRRSAGTCTKSKAFTAIARPTTSHRTVT